MWERGNPEIREEKEGEMGQGGRDEEKKEKFQSPSSMSYLWDVFLYLRLTEKTNMRIVRH